MLRRQQNGVTQRGLVAWEGFLEIGMLQLWQDLGAELCEHREQGEHRRGRKWL